jgi:multiple sugar transport system ATP-binding protein
VARIELERVTKRFGKVEAVLDLDLEIEHGTFTALLGPSGCGKTTTMNMLSGLLTPTAGEIRFDGRRVNEDEPGRRNVGFVFQNYAIFTHMSAFDNIALGLRIKKQPKAHVAVAVKRVAQMLGIEELLDRRATTLSVNDMQKVAIGRSMITNPDIFLLDEPFSNLDAAFRAYMRAELKRLQWELGQTMIYVTHDQVEAMAMAERIAIMNDGRLQQYGSPDEVYNRPANRFVAQFVGSTVMNFLPVEVEWSGDAIGLRMPVAEAAPIVLAADSGAARAVGGDGGGPYTLGIRPEHIRVVLGDALPDLRGTVTLVEPLGARNVVHLRAGEHRFRVVVPPTTRPRIGDAVGLELDRSLIHVFDDSTGLALR